MKRRIGRMVATFGVATALLVPSLAVAKDRDHWERDHYYNGYDRGMSDHERHEMEERARKAEKRREKELRKAYRNHYRSGPANGFYDRNGNYHPQGYYDSWGAYHPY